jgi:hypothetical protein
MNVNPVSLKHEIRRPKSETNPNVKTAEMFKTRAPAWFGIFHFRILNLFRISKFRFRIFLLCSLLPVASASAASTLEQNFVHPPASARPWVYWFWLNGNITSNGITADLEAMQRVGIGGVLIMEVDQGSPKGAADFGKPVWRGLFQHMLAEAHRLGLEVNMNNDAGWCGSGGPWITPELAMQKLVWTETNLSGPMHFEGQLSQPKAVSNYFGDITVLAFPTPANPARLEDIDGKAAFTPKQLPVLGTFASLAPDRVIARTGITELTSRCATNGLLNWDVPEGKWTVLRLGHTTTGKDNHPAPEPGRGLESDKLSKAATQLMFNELMGKLIADSKPLAGKTLVSTHIDSWETGSQNWTPRFREEFKKRRGYDPLPLLPVVTGRVVDSLEISERFLWDIRHTVSELVIENYAGELRRLAQKHGLRLSIEAYDGTPCDDMTYAGQADEPMAEFWSWGYNTAYSCVEMSSAAHVYGRRILGAEAFTATDGEKWLLHPALIKTLGDWAFCEGINRFVFHRYAMQPWLNERPGMSMGPWGLHYERTETWWDQSAAWHEYLARCQYLLRQGLWVADICFLEPEGSPMRFTPTMPWREGNTPERPRYNFDGCSPEVVMNRMKVKDGKLVLPDGLSYRVLVLPQVETMTPALLRRIKQLVEAGATVIGPPPRRAPGLTDYPKCDSEIAALSAQIWNTGASGKGRHILWDASFETPKPGIQTQSALRTAKWIWYPEGSPAASAPPGARYFRRVIVLPDKPASARFTLTADNSFELWVNGQSAGTGNNFNESYGFDILRLLKPGTNLLAVTAVNGADYLNPAGLIGSLVVKLVNGDTKDINTDGQWQTSTNASPNWNVDPNAIADSWAGAMELGALGMEPWHELAKPTGTPYLYPDFQAIAGILKREGVSPDFEADPDLRFIHRRDANTDIYFVANSKTNWLQSDCAFRVTGKEPEIWNPLTGHMTRAAVYEEKQGRTVVNLSLEPAGSRFVIFRDKAAKQGTGPIISIAREGRGIVPGIERGLAQPPELELSAQGAGEVRGMAFAPGNYQFTYASGQRRSVSVQPMPSPLELSGAWDVRFQSGRGAPEHATFEQLSDWSKNDELGIKYFSGTATYEKTFRMPAELAAEGLRQYLDLGNVEVMAQITLNGKNLGTLWKQPYNVEVTGALRPGENRLEIKVVNLWCNRMIGDEQLPEDSDRNSNGTLKHWPEWVDKDQPSPSGRFTFTSWRLWKKDSPLQPSGLIGPVKISFGREFVLK